MHSPPLFCCHKSKGSALMLILIILGLATALLVGALKSNPQIERDKITADALAKAKDALIGDTVSQLPITSAGYLRLPDLGFGPIVTTLSEGNAAPNFAGNATDYSVIGKVPWKNLGIAPSRDGQGECLWYVVSGRFKKSPTTAVLNWDTQGQIDVIDGNGNVVASNIAALLIAPGQSLDGQNRALSDPVYTQCGGNYDAQNYLDSYNNSDAVSGEVNYFTGSTNNRVALNANNKRFVLAKNDHYNDRLLFVTADDIFNKVRQRSDFKTAVDTLVSEFAACLNGLALLPEASAGNKGMVNALASCPAPIDPTKANFYNNWKDNLLYAKPGGPITVNVSTCDAVLIFGGARTGAQVRITATDKANATMYLEGVNATSFPGGTAYSGISAYSATTTSADIAACITGTEALGPPPGSDYSFSNNISSFDPAGSGGGSQVTINADGSATLYITGASNKSGCFWFPTANALYNKTMRAYFKFRFRDTETSTTSSSHGDGLTFTVLPGSANVAYVDGMCGDTNKSGYSGSDSGGHAPIPLPATNLAIEYDVFYNSAYADPSPANKNHIAVLTGSLDHGGITFSSPCNGTTAGCYPASTPNWLEDNVYHETRIEVFTGCDNTCSTCGASGAYSLVRAWVDCAECRDLNTSFTGTPGIQSCISTSSWLNSTTNTVKFGFTSGESAGVRQTIDLSDFGVKFE